MTNRFLELLDSRDVLVADGAMGTALFELGLPTGGCPELLNVERPALVAKVHRGYIDAGADIVLTNSFGGNRPRLALHQAGDRVAELNSAAARIARSAADSAVRTVAVAGSVGPTGELFQPLGPLSVEEGTEIFSEQMAALADGGVDVLWIETLSSWEELEAATAAAERVDLPAVATLSFDTNVHTMMGISPSQFGEWWDSRSDRPLAIGANCGIGPSDVVAAVGDIARAAPEAVVIAKGNCGIPLYKEEGLEYPAGPETMADYAELAIRSGARIVGACCGSYVDHIARLRLAVDARSNGGRPTRSEIEMRLGTISAPKPARSRSRARRR